MPWEISGFIAIPIFAAVVIATSLGILKLSMNKTEKISTLRLSIQIASVFAVFMGLILGPFGVARWEPLGPAPRDRLVGADLLGTQFPDGLSVPILACYYASGRTVTCPIWQLQAYVFPFWNFARGYDVFYSTPGLQMIAVTLGLVAVMSIVLGRFFCGWICPFGLYMDLLTRSRKVFRRRHLSFSEKNTAVLGQFGYVIIAVFMILSVIFGSYSIFGTQLIPGTIPGGPLGTEAGIVGNVNEPFCLVCPMRPLCVIALCATGYMKFSYVSQIAYGPLWVSGFYITSLNLVIFIIITVLSLAYRRLWCRFCPLGRLIALFSSFTPFKQIALTRLQKNEKTCTKCGICKRVCPTQATDVYEKKGGDVTESRCMLCFRCVEMCPEKGTLRITFAGRGIFKSRNWLEPTKTKS